MNRCIACYRCVRYYKDYAGGTDLGVYGAADNGSILAVPKTVCLESEFSGNLSKFAQPACSPTRPTVRTLQP
jgi:NADH-quinone oxidoreductase subunit G